MNNLDKDIEVMFMTFIYILKLVGRVNAEWRNENFFKSLLARILSLNLNENNQ